jgi:integrase
MATIRKIKNGNRMVFQLDYIHPVTGKRRRPTYRTRKDAESMKSRITLVDDMRKNGFRDRFIDEVMGYNEINTLDELWNWYSKNMTSNLDFKTVDRYRNVIDSFIIVFGKDANITSLRKLNINGLMGINIYKQFRINQGRSKHTINSELKMMKVLCNAALEEDLIDINPIHKKDIFSNLVKKPKKVWHLPRELNAIMHSNYLTELHKDLVTLYILTGARRIELVGVNSKQPYKEFHWEHILWGQNAILMWKKRSSERTRVPMPKMAMDILWKWRSEGKSAPIPYSGNYISKKMNEISQITGIAFTCHDLRRLSGQILIKDSKSKELARQFYGHSDISVTENSYADFSDNEIKYAQGILERELTNLA